MRSVLRLVERRGNAAVWEYNSKRKFIPAEIRHRRENIIEGEEEKCERRQLIIAKSRGLNIIVCGIKGESLIYHEQANVISAKIQYIEKAPIAMRGGAPLHLELKLSGGIASMFNQIGKRISAISNFMRHSASTNQPTWRKRKLEWRIKNFR